MEVTDLRSRTFNVIGEGSEVEGKIISHNETYLYGKMTGEIQVLSKDLTIERNAIVEGNIIAENVMVWGQVNGQIRANGKVILYPTAKVNGEVNASSLTVYPGSELTAKNAVSPIENSSRGQSPL